MFNFKVGDKVRRVKHSHGNHTVGAVYTIAGVTDLGSYLRFLEGGNTYIYDSRNYELVEEYTVGLTKIDKPFGELDNNTKLGLMKAIYIDNETVEVLSCLKTWVEVGNRDPFNPQKIYRLKPEKTPNQIKKESLELKLKEIQEELSQLDVKD